MIEFRNVSKVYNNGTEALHNINLKVEKGRVRLYRRFQRRGQKYLFEAHHL